MKKLLLMVALMLTLPLIMLFAGCGGGGGGGGGGVAASTVSGVAATGAPMFGTVYLKDSSSPTTTLSKAINTDGSFSFDISSLKPPFMLMAQSSSSGVLYSFAPGAGIANINPLADLAVKSACNTYSIYIYNNFLSSTIPATWMQTLNTNFLSSVNAIQTKLQPLLAAYQTTANPVSDDYIANHFGLDGIFDRVTVNSNSVDVTITNRLNNLVIYSGKANDFKNGVFTAANIPQPPVVINVTPKTATVTTNGTATFTAAVSYTTNTAVTWSVVDAGGGSITSAGVYTAPANAGTYHVKATSAADSSKSATATVTVNNAVNVTINPSSATIPVGGSATFTATVTGTSNTDVSWCVVESNQAPLLGLNTVSFSATNASATPGSIYHFKATSVADPTKSAIAVITITAATTATTFPIGTWVGPHGASFKLTSLYSANQGQYNSYSGSITYPTFGTLPVSGGINPLTDTSQIYLGSGFTVYANHINTSTGAFTFFQFLVPQYDNVNIPTNVSQMVGNLVIQSSTGVNYSEQAVFIKQ